MAGKVEDIMQVPQNAKVEVTIGAIIGENVRAGHIPTGKRGTLVFMVDLDAIPEERRTKEGKPYLCCAKVAGANPYDSWKVPGVSADGRTDVSWGFKLSANASVEGPKVSKAGANVVLRKRAV